MSGHSKWSSIKYQKGIKDVRRGKLFSKLSKNISVAARNGGDPSMNPSLRLAMDQAKAANMPSQNIERAIKRGTGELEGAQIEERKLEAYGPGGVALLLKILTDNKNRSFSEIKNILGKNRAKVADSGSVAYLFSPKGEIKLAALEHQPVGGNKIEEIIIESQALDFEGIEEGFIVYTAPGDLGKVKKYFEKKGLSIENVKLVQEAKDLLQITEKEQAQKIIKLLSELEEHEDVDEVYTNFDIPDEMIEEIS